MHADIEGDDNPHPAAVNDLMQGIASSHRYGCAAVAVGAEVRFEQVLPPRDPGEVRIQSARPQPCQYPEGCDRRNPQRFRRLQAYLPGPGRVNEEFGADVYRFIGSRAVQFPSAQAVACSTLLNFALIEVLHTGFNRATDDGTAIEFGLLEPLRVRSVSSRLADTSRALALSNAAVRPTSFVPKEAEPALQSASDLGVSGLPGAVSGEGAQPVEPEVIRDPRQSKVPERRRGFPDGEPRVPAAFEQHDRVSELPGDDGQQRATEPGAEDREIRSRIASSNPAPRRVGSGAATNSSRARRAFPFRPVRCFG